MSTATLARPTGTGLRGLLSAHLAVLRTRSGLALLALSVLVPLAGVVVTLLVGQQVFDLTGADLARPLTDNIGIPLFGILIGGVVAGSQYRHGTLVPILLGEPRRVRVVVSALLVTAGVATASALVTTLLGAAVALPWLAAEGVPTGEVLADPDLWWRVLGESAGYVVVAVLAAAIAVLVRGMLGPVLGLLGLAGVEGGLAAVVPGDWVRWTFFRNLNALNDPSALDAAVPIWHSALVVLGVLAAAVAAALLATARRDAA
jgi:ABC-2 type transport system permease protein